MTATHSTHPARKRGRCLATWCGLFSCLLLLPAHVVLGFAGGDGSAQNPYLIATAGHLDAVRNHHGAHFRLIADIDLGVAPWNDGMGWNPIGSVDRGFSGALDGAGFVIRNLTCMRPGVTYQGLFGVVSEATLRRVRLENAQVSGARFAGGLAGLAKDSVLRNLESTGGSITGQAHVGGLIGSLHGGSLHHASCAASVTGQDQVGGLGGSAYGADIQRTSAGGQVQGTREVGGLFGALGAEVPSELPQVLDYSPKSTSAGSPVFVLFDGDIGGLQEQITATFGSTPLPLTAFSESILQVILPANATSGDLRVHLGAASTAALPLVVAGPVTEPLFSRQVSPAADDQVIRHGDAVAIRIPPSILDQTRELSVSIVTHAPASPLNPADTTALDISIAGLTQLAAPIQVSLTYDPARLDPSRGAAEQMSVVRWDDELQIWIEMPYAVTEATQEIHFLTDHLSLFEVPIVGTMAKTAVKTLAGVATGPLVAEWLAGKVADTTYITPLGNFRFFFNKAEWDALAATWTRPGILGGMSYDPNHPASIQDIGTLFEVALANYLSRGFRNPVRKPGWLWGESVTPITVTIGGLWMESIGLLMEQSPEYNRVFGTITMPSRRVRNFNTDAPKKYATIGHELFHRIQAEYYSADRFGSIIGSDDYWWIEASAEYAGCREAWGRNNKAFDSVLSAGMQTDLLAYPLNATGMKPGWSRDLEYVHAAFIRFLVDQRNLDFKTMAERVSEGEPFNRLDYVIGAAGKDSLDIFYTYFATWAALVKESVLSAFTLADFKDLHSPTPENSEIVSRKDILSLQADRTLRVSRTGGETGINSVHLFLIPENTRIDPVDAYGRPGYHPPPGFFKRALYAMDPSADLNDLEPNRVLYLLANNGEASASLNVTIEVLNDGKPEGTPLRHVFDLPGGYSAQLWAVKLLAGKVEIASLPPSAPAASRWFPTLQSALDAAAEGADIRVYPGVFEEPGALTIDIRKSVNLRAVKGPEETILRANTIGWNRWIVIYETAANVRIEGFTIEPGAVRPTWASSGVIGIEARPGTRVNILGNHFNGFTWAAIYAQGATGILSRNVFAGNDTGIQAINAPELITVNGNTIRDGRIGVSLTNSAALIKGNTIESGTGSGIRIRGAALTKTPFFALSVCLEP